MPRHGVSVSSLKEANLASGALAAGASLFAIGEAGNTVCGLKKLTRGVPRVQSLASFNGSTAKNGTLPVGPLSYQEESRMNASGALLTVAMLVGSSGCSTTSSSTATGPTGPAWDKPVLVSQSVIPAGIPYKVIGSVQADARAGYDSAERLYPLLAAEARKMGANAVVNATGGRRVTAFSWSAAYVRGMAIKVDDPEKLKGLPGTYH